MRYVAAVDGKSYNVDLIENGKAARLQIDGQNVDVDLRQVIAPSLFSFIKDGKSFEVFAEPTEKGYAVVIAGQRFLVDVADERSLRLASVQKREVQRRGSIVVKSPMPGLVVDVYVQPGDTVQAGQSLLILMAMKMENNIRAFEGGKVTSLRVQKGDKVELGQLLLTIG
jgi:biotin carboxyl carrier protein